MKFRCSISGQQVENHQVWINHAALQHKSQYHNVATMLLRISVAPTVHDDPGNPRKEPTQ